MSDPSSSSSGGAAPSAPVPPASVGRGHPEPAPELPPFSLPADGAPVVRFRPRTGSMEAWNAAYGRVEDYLRAHRIHNRLHQSRLVEAILARAAERHAHNPALDPVTLAAEETEQLLDLWFARLLGPLDLPPERLAAAGRVALLLCDGPQRWPYAFLDTQLPPEELVGAMRASSIKAGPDLAVSAMVPREIELGALVEAAGETLERIEKWPVVRTLFLWTLFVAALAAVFMMTR